MYSQKRNCAASAPIPHSCVCELFIYSHRPRNSFSVNICFEFSVLCLYSVDRYLKTTWTVFLSSRIFASWCTYRRYSLPNIMLVVFGIFSGTASISYPYVKDVFTEKQGLFIFLSTVLSSCLLNLPHLLTSDATGYCLYYIPVSEFLTWDSYPDLYLNSENKNYTCGYICKYHFSPYCIFFKNIIFDKNLQQNGY